MSNTPKVVEEILKDWRPDKTTIEGLTAENQRLNDVIQSLRDGWAADRERLTAENTRWKGRVRRKNKEITEAREQYAERMLELTAENERLTALLTVAAINPQADPQEVRNFQIALDGAWFEREQEVEQLKEKIVAAGYRLDSSAAEIRRSREALDEMVKYQAGEMQVILPENERLREALRPFAGAYNESNGQVKLMRVGVGSLHFERAADALEAEQPQ